MLLLKSKKKKKKRWDRGKVIMWGQKKIKNKAFLTKFRNKVEIMHA